MPSSSVLIPFSFRESFSFTSIAVKEKDSGESAVLVSIITVSYTHLRAHETDSYLVCRLLLEKKKDSREEKRINS